MSETEITKIIELVSKHTGLRTDKIFLGSRLEKDLGCIGDDTYELFEEIHELYKVNFNGVAFDDYITPEVEGFFGFMFNRKQVQKRQSFPITVQHLVNIVESGAWFEPPQVK
jgi:hypothetical protein